MKMINYHSQNNNNVYLLTLNYWKILRNKLGKQKGFFVEEGQTSELPDGKQPPAPISRAGSGPDRPRGYCVANVSVARPFTSMTHEPPVTVLNNYHLGHLIYIIASQLNSRYAPPSNLTRGRDALPTRNI